MSPVSFSIEKKTPFAESLVWQINKDFYNQNGIAAWRDEIVPHQITNSSLAATTYAESIFAFLKDQESLQETKKKVYILELGAGHGRLCYNILGHLDQLIEDAENFTTEYCYVLSDIVEDNLEFYSNHPKLKAYYDRGVLDISYFDAAESHELILRKSGTKITPNDLEQPILSIANYFFDSLPNSLFYFQDDKVYDCAVSIDSQLDPMGKSAQELIKEMELTFHTSNAVKPYFENEIFNNILAQYAIAISDAYVLFPKIAMECLSKISSLSKMGLVLLTLDKGYKEIIELTTRKKPDFIKHGSFSLWVNFHAMSQYCILKGGLSMFDVNMNLSIDLGCLMLIKQPFKYHLFEQTFHKHSNQMNLDDLNSLKAMLYKNVSTANLSEILGLIRLNSYDASIFIKLLPNIKKLSKRISLKHRTRLGQTITKVWSKYYTINNDYDFSYELGGLMYDLGYYDEALGYFKHSTDTFGNKVDVDYNQILCYYQLREDTLFYETLNAAKLRFPDAEEFANLDKLDMG